MSNNQATYNIAWDQASVVTREGRWTRRKIKEGIAIKERKNNLNLDKGFHINNWFTLTEPSNTHT